MRFEQLFRFKYSGGPYGNVQYNVTLKVSAPTPTNDTAHKQYIVAYNRIKKLVGTLDRSTIFSYSKPIPGDAEDCYFTVVNRGTTEEQLISYGNEEVEIKFDPLVSGCKVYIPRNGVVHSQKSIYIPSYVSTINVAMRVVEMVKTLTTDIDDVEFQIDGDDFALSS